MFLRARTCRWVLNYSILSTILDPEDSAHTCSFFGEQNPICNIPFSEPADQNSICFNRVARMSNYTSASLSSRSHAGRLIYFSGKQTAEEVVSTTTAGRLNMWKRGLS